MRSKGEGGSRGVRGRYQHRGPRVVKTTVPRPTCLVNEAGQPLTVYSAGSPDGSSTRAISTGRSCSWTTGRTAEHTAEPQSHRHTVSPLPLAKKKRLAQTEQPHRSINTTYSHNSSDQQTSNS